jgi:hypothetical protein
VRNPSIENHKNIYLESIEDLAVQIGLLLDHRHKNLEIISIVLENFRMVAFVAIAVSEIESL